MAKQLMGLLSQKYYSVNKKYACQAALIRVLALVGKNKFSKTCIYSLNSGRYGF
jgi:hypothetical protein